MDWLVRSARYPDRGNGDHYFVAIAEEYLAAG
jgi:hypothetical protein